MKQFIQKWKKHIIVGTTLLAVLVIIPTALATSSNNHIQARNHGARNLHRGGMVTGQLTAINGNSLTVLGKNGTPYTVDATNAKVMVDGQASPLSALVVNDTIVVKGTPSTTDKTQITATMILKGKMPFKGHGKREGRGNK